MVVISGRDDFEVYMKVVLLLSFYDQSKNILMSCSIFHEMTNFKKYCTILREMIKGLITVTNTLFSTSKYTSAYLILLSFLLSLISEV